MSRNSRNVESAKNHISEFSPNSPFSSKLPFSRAPLPSYLSWKLYFGEFSPYLLFSSNWPLSSKSLLWTAPPCHIIWLVHITMANFAILTVFAKFAIFVKIANLKGDPWSFLISLVPKALANFRLIRHFRQNRLFPTFLITGVWISLYSCISAKLIQVYWKQLQCSLSFICEVFLTEIDPLSRQSFTLRVISKQNLSALKLARMAYFFHVVVICQEFFFLSLTVFKLVGYFIPDHGYSVGNSKLNWVKNVQIITS